MYIQFMSFWQLMTHNFGEIHMLNHCCKKYVVIVEAQNFKV